ncbi:hypothetical protein M9Y10_013724 [Tritrichomonas musculus]|uniref:Meiosis protein 5 homolog n=1 Tax=Tritrichomonas musculus TaxID=1915356 RepID=A0ABR2KXL0_9EUKA
MSSPQTLLSFFLNATSPLTLEDIVSQTGRDQSDVEKELNTLLEENSIRKRVVTTKSNESDGNSQTKAIYWPSSIIPFISTEPIITSPFQLPFDHSKVLDRLTDQQLQQEKVWLQTKLRKVNAEFENLQHRANKKITEEEEKLLDSLTLKWLNATQEMLEDLVSKIKNTNPEMNMNRLLHELRIDPKTVKWNSEDECFDS